MITISEKAFDPGTEITAFERRVGDAGAIVSFVGKVRGTSGDKAVQKLTLEHFAGMTEKSMAAIDCEARARWSIDDTLIIHRIGDLAPGDAIVLVCVASAHRRAAFEAADFLMDYLKTEALFWKKESCDGTEIWIEPRRADYEDAKRWKKGQKKARKRIEGCTV